MMGCLVSFPAWVFVVRSSDDLTKQQVEDYVKGQVAEHKQLIGGVK